MRNEDLKKDASKAKKAALYVRVSTDMQADKDSLPMQKRDLIAYSDLILGIQDYVIFEDAGYSGKNTDRPAFQQMMERVRQKEFSHVLVWKIDRISRNLLDFAATHKELKDLGVTFVSKNEQFDTSTAIGEAMLKIILVFAELERNMTAERVTATMISRASNGQWNGGRIPFGYSYDKETKTFSIIESEKAVCILLRDFLLQSKSLVYTARHLNSLGYHTRSGADWSPTAVWIIASSPFYTGSYRYNRYKGTQFRKKNPESEWVIVSDHHPAIYSQEDHEAMISLFADNRRNSRDGGYRINSQAHVFSGLVYCGKCDLRMIATPGKLRKSGYRPSMYTCPKKKNTNQCSNPATSDILVGNFVINYIINMLNAKKSFSKISSLGELQRVLLRGLTFSKIKSIESCGLKDYYNLLSNYDSDDSFIFSVKASGKKVKILNPEIATLRSEQDRLKRALKRLQDLYLYSDSAISESEYIIRRSEILSNLEEISKKLGMMNTRAEDTINDEDFIKLASHLLISKYLKDRKFIIYEELAQNVSTDVLKQYMNTILDSVHVINGKVLSITFRNGLTHRFIYKGEKAGEP